jgi:serine phosphatase RsbU (regulator of sigma subunit)/glyoxylase-like metal-dependent hydrolase (beta-lactamase superfamily II)
MIKKFKDNQPIKISKHVYWIGTHDASDTFQCNSYLIVINGRGIIIDPGSVLFFDNLLKKVTGLLELKDITHVVIQHQDPDVGGSIALLAEAIRSTGNRRCKILAHSRSAVLIRHYGAKLKMVHTNALSGQKLVLNRGAELEFIHTPYLHAPGAIATYFNRDKILFSSDIFGGMTTDWHLFSGERYFEEITSFHQDYMPAKELLLFTMTKFERLDIELIAPQHGSVMKKAQAAKMIKAFKNFECGLFIDQAFREELQAAQKKIEVQNIQMSKELYLAGEFQQSLLPDKKLCSSVKELDIAFKFKPCAQVSGDFLIIDQITPRHLGIMVVDVAGHGVVPGLTTIQLKTLFNEYKSSTLSPAALLKKINEKAFVLTENDIFLTALYLIYDMEDSRFTIASAGGIPAIYFNAQKNKGRLLSLTGTSLGICQEDACQIDDRSFAFGINDFIMLQTDGLIECVNRKNIPFERIKSQKKFIQEIKKGRSAQAVIDAIMNKVNRFKGRSQAFQDDITLVVIKKVD